MSLFDDLAEASGLAPLLAPFTLSRLLIRAGVDPKNLTLDGIERALPELEDGLRVYLQSDEYDRAVKRIRDLAASAPSAGVT